MKDKLWCDLKTDKERVEFLRSGRAWETGIIAKSIVEDVAEAFDRLSCECNEDIDDINKWSFCPMCGGRI